MDFLYRKIKRNFRRLYVVFESFEKLINIDILPSVDQLYFHTNCILIILPIVFLPSKSIPESMHNYALYKHCMFSCHQSLKITARLIRNRELSTSIHTILNDHENH